MKTNHVDIFVSNDALIIKVFLIILIIFAFLAFKKYFNCQYHFWVGFLFFVLVLVVLFYPPNHVEIKEYTHHD